MQQACQISIKYVSRLGNYAPMRTRAILVEFYHKSDAEFLLSNRTHLPQGVYINCQYSDETEKERRKLRPILRSAHINENYKGRCKMEGSKLVIKGKKYDSSNLHLLPGDINRFQATSKINTENNVLDFFGELNPMSNFHLVKFNINGVSYHSCEQYIQHQKSIMFGDKSAEQMILSSKSALECKAIAKTIQNYDHKRWKDNAKATCTPGILAKFEQHPTLTSLLRSTGSKKLVECCNDKDWGTGVPLFKLNALKSSDWHSQGLLGEILETIRNVLNTEDQSQNLAVTAMEADNPT